MITAEDLKGQPVICAAHDGVFTYDGTHDWGTSVSFDLRNGTHKLRARFESVAPADTVIPAKDARVSAVKGDRPRDWRTIIDGEAVTERHPTKRDAIKAGLLRLAIMDWHAANSV